jgi:hypothetical protein
MPVSLNRSRMAVLRSRSALLLCALCALLLSPAAASAATRHVAPGGSDSGACDQPANPCGTLGYAYRQATPGDEVQVSAGSYPKQAIPTVSGRTGPPIEIRPAAGAAVTLGALDIAGSHVTVRDIATGPLDIDAGQTEVAGVTVVNGGGPSIWISNTRDLRIVGGSYGGNQDKPTVQINGNPPSHDMLFDGVDFHDAVATNSSVHMECIWVAGVQGFTVRNSMFRNCAYFDIFFTTLNSPDPSNVMLENNVFEVTKQSNGQDAPYAVNISNWLSRVDNFVIRNNTFGGDLAIQPATIASSRIVGNAGTVASCKDGFAYAYNVWTRAKCSATDRQTAAVMGGFADPPNHDWHLKAGSPAVDAASPSDYPVTDRDGLARRGAPDAGAHELGGVAPGGSGSSPPTPAQGTSGPRPRLVGTRLKPAKICRRARRGCPSSTRLSFRLTHDGDVVVRLLTRRAKRTARKVRKTASAGRVGITIRARGLRRGSYRVETVAAAPGAGSSRPAVRYLKVK